MTQTAPGPGAFDRKGLDSQKVIKYDNRLEECGQAQFQPPVSAAAASVCFGEGMVRVTVLRSTETEIQTPSSSTPKLAIIDLPGLTAMPGLAPRKGLQLPKQLSFEKWLRIGKQLSGFCTLSAWCLGDWLVYGEVAYAGRYREAIDQTSLDYQTLRNYAWVARRFSLPRRREALSFGHHAEVAALSQPEQDFWLRKAEEFGWSVKRLRREVRTSLKERSVDEDNDHGSLDRHEPEWLTAARLEIHITSEQLERCQAAAEIVGLSMEEWAASVLEQAARYALDVSA